MLSVNNKIRIYIIKNWIDINNINWNILSKNPNAIQLLEKNIDKINWFWFLEIQMLYNYLKEIQIR